MINWSTEEFICFYELRMRWYCLTSDDDRIVSHDASRLGLYYHCVRDVIIYFTLSGWNHGVLSCLSEWITVWIAWLCFQGYWFNLCSLRFQWEFCHYSEGFYSLVCREVHISYVENICKRRRNFAFTKNKLGWRNGRVIRVLEFLTCSLKRGYPRELAKN